MPKTPVVHQDIWVLILEYLFMEFFVAPEVMCRQNHGIAVDYYAAGIIAYECMFG